MNGVNMASPIMLEAMEGGGGAWAILGTAAAAAVGVALSSHAPKTVQTTPSVSSPPTNQNAPTQAPDGIY